MRKYAKKKRLRCKDGLPIGKPSEKEKGLMTDMERDTNFKKVYCILAWAYKQGVLDDYEFNKLLLYDLDHIEGQKIGRHNIGKVQLLSRETHIKKTEAKTKEGQIKDYRNPEFKQYMDLLNWI